MVFLTFGSRFKRAIVFATVQETAAACELSAVSPEHHQRVAGLFSCGRCSWGLMQLLQCRPPPFPCICSLDPQEMLIYWNSKCYLLSVLLEDRTENRGWNPHQKSLSGLSCHPRRAVVQGCSDLVGRLGSLFSLISNSSYCSLTF